jgi:hypothetical protein
MHYDHIFSNCWNHLGRTVVYQPTCLQAPYDDVCWPIKYPTVEWTDNTVVMMHCQDFLTVNADGICPELEEITQHFGERANQVVVLHWNVGLDRLYSGPCHLIHFPTHSYEIAQRLKTAPYENWQELFNADRTRNWQCLNGAAREHRIQVWHWLREKPNGIVSLADIDPLPQDDYKNTYIWRPFEHDLNERNFIKLNWLYSTTKVNIVTETSYGPAPGIITEKTLFALLAKQIPIVIGYPGIVEHCRSLGFDMFDDLVDNSYDFLPDEDRITQALERNYQLIVNTPDLSHVQARLEKQRNYVLNEWPIRILDNFKSRINEIHNLLTKI